MSRRGVRVIVTALTVVALVEGLFLAAWAARVRWQRRAAGSAVARGRAVAEAAGCFGCHGPEGVSGIPNPGAKGGEVPGWPGGTWMMWNRSQADVRTWIEKGSVPGHTRAPDQLLIMPAYGSILETREIDDLVAYVLTVSQFGMIEDQEAAEGRDVATRHGCFGCHGPEGRGLVRNPRSFRGYIPPWDGPDYPELVRSRDEFGQWVRKGISDRFERNPVARRILENQAIGMPAYGDRIASSEMDALYAYVQWVRRNPRHAR